MAGVLKFCPKCKQENIAPWYGFYPFMAEDAICSTHSEQMITIHLSEEDYFIILRISHDPNFLEAMIKLKENDIVEYESRMSQFRSQVEQQKVAKQVAEEKSKPHCPHCNSTDIKSLSMVNRGASIAIWGIFSKKINKSFECRKCGYTW